MTEQRTAPHGHETAEAMEAPEAASLQVCDATGTRRPCVHVFKKGDTLSAIASKYHVKYPDELKKVNPNLFPPKGSPDRIPVGLRVVIPPKK